MPSTTLSALRLRVLKELDLGLFVTNSTITAFAAGSMTAPGLFQNSRWGAAHFASQGTVIFRPTAATAADYIRYAGNLTNTSGLLAHTGANYADTTLGSEHVELWYREIRPDIEVVDAFNRALEFIYFSTMVALSHLSDQDGDMAASTDTLWTDVLTPTTSAKSTTARRTPWGMRSYNLINNAVDEGTRSATMPVSQGKQYNAFTIGSANVGTASFRPYDITNSAVVGDAVTHSEEEPQLMAWRGSVPATCKEVANYHLGTTSDSDIFWNMSWGYVMDRLRVNFPAYVTEEFMVPTILQGRPRNSTGTNLYDAQSLDFVELIEGKDYQLLFHQADANPYAALFKDNSYFEWPLFVQARRPYADLTTFILESDSTTCPLHLLVPAAKLELLRSVYLPRDPQNVRWLQMYADAYRQWTEANVVRPVTSVATSRQNFRIGKA